MISEDIDIETLTDRLLGLALQFLRCWIIVLPHQIKGKISESGEPCEFPTFVTFIMQEDNISRYRKCSGYLWRSVGPLCDEVFLT